MPYNLFIIPLITGYYILTCSYLLKYNSQRFIRSRILFESIFIGLLIVTSGFIFRTILKAGCTSCTENILAYLANVPIDKPKYLYTIIFASFIAIIITWILNALLSKYYDEQDPIVWAVEKHGDEIEKLFKDSAKEGFAIMLTLKNHKVYIGFCNLIPIPQKTNYLILTPLISGYKNSETKAYTKTTDYFKVVNEFIDDLGESNDDDNDAITLNIDIIIKQDEILTAGRYEPKIDKLFHTPNESKEREH